MSTRALLEAATGDRLRSSHSPSSSSLLQSSMKSCHVMRIELLLAKLDL